MGSTAIAGRLVVVVLQGYLRGRSRAASACGPEVSEQFSGAEYSTST